MVVEGSASSPLAARFLTVLPVMKRFVSLALLLAALPALSACDAQPASKPGVEAPGEVADLRTPSVALSRGLASRNATVRSAAAAIAQGSPWTASRALMPLLGRPETHTADVVLLAARAAAEWEGWSEVDRLLAGAPWIDTALAGEGRELLARSALASNGLPAAERARAHAEAALRTATDRRARGVRHVLLARALDRLDRREEARAAYERATASLPQVGDWLRLRAAGVTEGPDARNALYAAVRSPAAKARIPWTEALSRDRFHDYAGAARLYDSLGAPASAFRLRLAAAPDSAATRALRQEALRALPRLGGGSSAREIIALLDSSGTLAPAEELVVARAARETGNNARAARGYARAAASLALSSEDRYGRGLALYASGQAREGARVLATISGGALAPRARYQQARALLRAGDGAGARRTLAAVVKAYPQSGAAADAQYLLADLATDDGRDTEARRLFRDVASRWPSSSRASNARFRAGIIAAAAGSWRDAGADFDAVVSRWPSAPDADAARYWAARARAQSGDRADATRRWRALIARSPLSYYAMLAARRLDTTAWAPRAVRDSVAIPPDVGDAVARIEALELLGMDTESRFELDALAGSAERDSLRLLAVAAALRDAGYPSRAVTLAFRAIGEGVRDQRAYRLAYPVVHRDVLETAAQRHRLDPALVAALIRQESSFNPRARSPVGARGLMQLMPDVGRDIARARGYPIWHPALLYEPDVSIELGTAHLAAGLREWPSLARALAAYNAGGSRVRRWTRKPGAGDPEIFAERIPFDETRDYVRIVQRNVEVYRALYGWN